MRNVIPMLIKRHPLAMLFVAAAWAFIGWNMRHDLAGLAMVVVMPMLWCGVMMILTKIGGATTASYDEKMDVYDPQLPGSLAWLTWGRHLRGED